MKKIVLPLFALAVCSPVFFLSGCKEEPAHEHVYASEYSYNSEQHFYGCTIENCSSKKMAEDHDFTEWVSDPNTPCTEEGERTRNCEICGYVQTETTAQVGHSWSSNYGFDAENHWYPCLKEGCEEVNQVLPHTYVEGVCQKCGATKPSEGLEFALSEDGSYYIITSIGTCSDTTLSTPFEYNGLPVKEIATEAFKNQTQLIYVIINDSIEKIGAKAFMGCSNLLSYTSPFVGTGAKLTPHFSTVFGTIPESLKYVTITKHAVGDSQFKNCETIESVVMLGNFETLGYYAFQDCKSLQYVQFPAGLKKISGYSFNGCVGLTEMTIPDSVEILQPSFNGCYNLCTITFGKNLKEYSGWDFEGCYKLVEIENHSSLDLKPDNFHEVDIKNIYKPGENETILRYDSHGFIYFVENDLYYMLGKSVINNTETLALPPVINNNIYGIYDYAFYKWDKLETIQMPDTIFHIGKYAFAECVNLTTGVNTPNARTIGDYAFYECSKITLNNFKYVENVGDYTFYDCSSMKVVNGDLSNLVTVGARAFRNCKMIATYGDFNNLKTVGEDAFVGCNRLAFELNLNSIEVVATDGLLVNNVRVMNLGPNLRTFNVNFKDYYHNVIEVKNSSSLDLSERCSEIENYYTDESGSSIILKDDKGFVYTFEDEKYSLVTKVDKFLISELILPDSFNGNSYEIAQSAFQDCSNITSIKLSDGVTSIGGSAFSNTGIRKIKITSNVQYIGRFAFAKCQNLEEVIVDIYFNRDSIGGDLFDLVPGTVYVKATPGNGSYVWTESRTYGSCSHWYVSDYIEEE